MEERNFLLKTLHRYLDDGHPQDVRFGLAIQPPPEAIWHKRLRCMLPLAGRYAPTCRYSDGIGQRPFAPDEALCMLPRGWTLPNWQSPHEVLAIVMHDGFVRYLWYRHPGNGRPLPNGPQYWYHTASGPNPVLQNLVRTLEALGDCDHSRPARVSAFEAFLHAAADCLAQDRARTGNKSRYTWQAVLDYLERHCHTPIDRNSVARRFHLHPNYLSRLFSQNAGETFHACLIRLRLERARELLNDPALNIDDIATRCGFTGTSYFIKVFRNHYGTSPGRFRQERTCR